MYAFTHAVSKGVPVKVADLTLNLTVIREVQRERRRIRRGSEDREVVDAGSLERCAFCDRGSVYQTTRWPDPTLCIREYVCELCMWQLSHMVETLGVAPLARM